MTHAPEPDAEAVITAYFAEGLAMARADAEKAAAALAEAEQAAAAFASEQELPPAVGGMKQGWDLAAWSGERARRIASDAIDGKASPEQYYRAKAESEAVLEWLDANGYEVPAPYRR
ncbi:hypothetical protein [Streptomyces turgidiscabies]|uniref:Uncharacterized protein n=1 Tax=Streptomyces turgidiscabies TaxID=85558 RepID=A0ABU0RP67_9ACTN|nr:hypothetical protein [Streptomyces turgidiscabies]MDQ0933788.1 hypothetical protein [Streptomyces turgidiscabies]